MRGIVHAGVLSVTERIALTLGPHGDAEETASADIYWEWLRYEGGPKRSWLSEMADMLLSFLGKHPEWEALCPEKKERLVQLANELLTGHGLDHLQRRAAQLFDSYQEGHQILFAHVRHPPRTLFARSSHILEGRAGIASPAWSTQGRPRLTPLPLFSRALSRSRFYSQRLRDRAPHRAVARDGSSRQVGFGARQKRGFGHVGAQARRLAHLFDDDACARRRVPRRVLSHRHISMAVGRGSPRRSRDHLR